MKNETEILLEARKKLGLTQQQVADKARIHINQYQKFESGTRKLTSSSFSIASAVLQSLGLDVTAFARGDYFGQNEVNRE
ncbi:MAG: helix-turn-helix transcriptional regulator [Firmicutes bacterium]|nr:helix-turn-helix transcriptional regulator [Bacillota bacterium]